MKHLNLKIDPERLKADPELETQFLKMFGREQLNKVYSDEGEFDFTDSEIKNMSDAEFAEKRLDILEAAAKGRVLKDD